MSHSPHEEKRAHQSVQAMYTFLNKKVSSTLVCNLTADLPGANIYSRNGSNWELRSLKCKTIWMEVKTPHKQQNTLIQSNNQSNWTYSIQVPGTNST
jgi:hypothetical protein